MKLKFNYLAILILSILFITSCQKEKFNPNLKSDNLEDSNSQQELKDGWINQNPIEFSSNSSERKPINNKSTRQVVWAIGASNRVFKSIDNGNSWSEPNPSAGLVDISVGDNGVWGIGSDKRVYRWNGSYWFEPNPAARATQISASSESDAWVTTEWGTVYATNNGGLWWYPANNMNDVGSIKEVSTGAWNQTYGITTNNQLVKYDFNIGKFILLGSTVYSISTNPLGDLFAIGASGRIFYSYDGISWTEPNPSASASQICSYGAYNAYALGTNRIFKSIDLGNSWTEPNPAASAFQISNGIEYY